MGISAAKPVLDYSQELLSGHQWILFQHSRDQILPKQDTAKIGFRTLHRKNGFLSKHNCAISCEDFTPFSQIISCLLQNF